jgi:LmbE family N-acetylglucosaminyl deacetylase
MRVLVVAPHADDETLGVGGTIARYARNGHEVHVAVMTGPGEGRHPVFPRSTWDTVRAEARRACGILGVNELTFRELPAVQVSEEPLWRLNRETLSVVDTVRPDVLFVPFPHDLHRDHRDLFHSFSVAWRPVSEVGQGIREVYAYEVPSQTHLNAPYLEPGFLPNAWIDISEHLGTKLAALACYESQLQPFPHMRSVETVEALARFRGAQAAMEAAEAFVLIRRLEHA